jgi:hypothetical protein
MYGLSPNGDRQSTGVRIKMSFDDVPLSETSVTLKLAEIQKRCSELISDPELEIGGLALEDPISVELDKNFPYGRG